MASQPRAARRGGKVATPATTGNTPGLLSGSPSAKLPESPVAEDTENGATPSFLNQGSLLQLNNDATSHVAVGVVRGRSQRDAAQDREIVAKVEDVASSVSKALDASANANAKAIPEVTALPSGSAGVFLIREAECLKRASLLSQTEGAKVLFVAPYPTDVDSEAVQTLGEDCATWYGNTETGLRPDSKLIITDLSTLQIHLSTNKSLKPFTHLVLTQTSGSIVLYQSVLFMIRGCFKQAGKKTKQPKIYIATYAEGQDISLKAYFEEYQVETEGALRSGAEEVTSFNGDEVAAYTGVAALKPGRNIEDRSPITGVVTVLPQPKVIDRVHQQVFALVKKLVSEPRPSNLRILVFSGDAASIQSQFAREGPENVEVVSSIDTFATTSVGEKHQVVFETRLAASTALNKLDVNVVIDEGTERALAFASKAEQVLPTKRTEWATLETCNQRQRVLGHRRPGVYFNVMAEEDAQSRAAMMADPTPLCTADHAVIQLSRFYGTETVELLQQGPTRPTVDAMESALVQLNEKNAIAGSTETTLTFLGEILARSGLGLDLASFMVNGLICGLPELFATACAVIVAPIRGIPKNLNGKDMEEWLANANIAIKAAGGSKNSDVIADMTSYLRCANDPEASKTEQIDSTALARTTAAKSLILQRLSDFIVPGPEVSASQLQHQLETRHREIEFFLAASLARNALAVKSEGAITGKPASGNLLFLRTSKEVQANGYAPTSMAWKNGTVVIPTNLNNTSHRIFATGGSLVHQNFFFTALVLLSPTLEYSSPMQHKGEQVICFSVTVNRNAKRFHTDVATAARILEFREQWNTLLGAVQVKRSLPNKVSRLQVLSALQSKDGKFDLDGLRTKAVDEFATLVQTCEMKEYQTVFQPHGQHRTVPSTEVKFDKISPATDTALSEKIATGNFESDAETKIEETSSSKEALGNNVVVEEEDDIEVEGQGFFAGGPVIEEEDDD